MRIKNEENFWAMIRKLNAMKIFSLRTLLSLGGATVSGAVTLFHRRCQTLSLGCGMGASPNEDNC